MNRKHHNLKTWIKAIELVKEIYQITNKFPKEEIYVMSAQMRRAAISIPSNIAEGAARRSNRELLNYLSIARGSLSELETQVIISKKLNYLQDENNLLDKINEVFGLLGGLINAVKNKIE